MFPDELYDRIRHEIANRFSAADHFPKYGRGNVQFRSNETVDFFFSESAEILDRVFRTFLTAWPAGTDEMTEFEKAAVVFPCREIDDCIGSRNKIKYAVRSHVFPHLTDGIYRIGNTGSVDFYRGNRKMPVSLYGQFRHAEPERLIYIVHTLVRRVSGRNEDYPFQAEFLPGRLGNDQMAYMYRIEGTAEYAYPFSHNSIPVSQNKILIRNRNSAARLCFISQRPFGVRR